MRLTVAAGWFDDDIRAGWGDWTADSYLRPRPPAAPLPMPSRPEREAALAGADVVLAGFPVPVDLRARCPRLRWVHQTPAGASNLRRCDLWGSDVAITTSRGLGNTLAIAEWVVASFLHFARQLHRAPAEAAAGRFDRFAYRPVLFAGKTVCVVGAGGIGRDVGRLCAALGARVVGTRRSPVGPGEPLPEGFSEMAGPERLGELLAQSTFVAVCAQWTPETHGLIGAETLAAMPDGAVLANVARGELIDEDALRAHLDRLGGVALDVYVGEFEHAPPAWLWAPPPGADHAPRVGRIRRRFPAPVRAVRRQPVGVRGRRSAGQHRRLDPRLLTSASHRRRRPPQVVLDVRPPPSNRRRGNRAPPPNSVA